MARFDRVGKFLSGLPGFPMLGLAPEKELEARVRDLLELQAYVDPSRVIANKLFSAYNPEVLVARKGLGIFDTMKRDEQVKAALTFKKNAILAPGWEIQSPENQPEDWEVSEFVRDQLLNVKGGFKKSLKKFMLNLDYGYSVTEKLYEPVTEGKWNGKVGLTQLVSVKPHFIDFLINQHGQLLSVIQRARPVTTNDWREVDVTSSGKNGIIPQFPPAKFVIAVHDDEFENVYGTSDLVAAYRAWWLKDNAYKWLGIYLERFGMPPVIAMYNAGAYQGDALVKLKQFIKSLMSATFGVLPRYNKEDVELWSQEIGTSSREIYSESIKMFDQAISRALLVPGLIGMTADEGVGSLARSGTHFDAFMMTLEDEQQDLASIINDQLIRQLCDLNFPGLDEYPQFKFLQYQDEKKLEILGKWIELVNAKIVNRVEDDERHVRNLVGFPENPEPVLEPLPVDADREAKAKAEADAKKSMQKAKPVDKAKLSEEQIAFAEENFGVWVELHNGDIICVDDAEYDWSKQ